MTPDELRAIMEYIRNRVELNPDDADNTQTILFSEPTEEEMIGAGLDAAGVRQILGASWWDEMASDIIETPDFCEPDDTPQQVLEYARDVVSDYLRKRVQL